MKVSTITKADIRDAFSELKDNGIDPKKKILWNYFFMDKKLAKLKEAAYLLQELGYTPDSIDSIDEGKEKFYALKIEKAQVHTVESLAKLNTFFKTFCKKNGVFGYDGFECNVGRVVKN